jgi:hypothetical protein
MDEARIPADPVAISDSVKAQRLDRTLQQIGAAGRDRPPRGADLPLKPGRNYLNNGTNFAPERKPNDG